ncbi:RNA-directed DNA polymerase, eukaryota [Tanacetum coccineum]
MEAWDPILRNESDDSSSSDDEDELENKGSLNGDSNYNDKEINRVSKSNCMNRDARASKVLSEDPFNLYEILNKTKESSSISKEDDLKYPPGFTPKVVTVEEAEAKDTEFLEQFSKKDMESVLICMVAKAFNNFISLASLIDLPLDGYAFTWAYKSATKMSKLDRFLISKGLMALFPHLLALCLDKHLSDHRPILMRENTPRKVLYKAIISIHFKLSDLTKFLYQGGRNEEILNKRSMLLKELHDINSIESMEVA